MTIAFVGHGYVGLVTAAVFADLGNTVWVVGHTPSKIENLKKGILPIYEPGLEELVKRNIKANRLHFTLDYAKAIPLAKVVFIAVGTPPKKNGEADLSVVFDVAAVISMCAERPRRSSLQHVGSRSPNPSVPAPHWPRIADTSRKTRGCGRRCRGGA